MGNSFNRITEQSLIETAKSFRDRKKVNGNDAISTNSSFVRYRDYEIVETNPQSLSRTQKSASVNLEKYIGNNEDGLNCMEKYDINRCESLQHVNVRNLFVCTPSQNSTPIRSALKGSRQGSQLSLNRSELLLNNGDQRNAQTGTISKFHFSITKTSSMPTEVDKISERSQKRSKDKLNPAIREEEDENHDSEMIFPKSCLVTNLESYIGDNCLFKKDPPSPTNRLAVTDESEVATQLCKSGFGPTIRHLSVWILNRPTPMELSQNNIISKDAFTEEQDLEYRKSLVKMKASKLDLRSKTVSTRFSKYVEVGPADHYYRIGDRPWLRIREEDKIQIRRELNEFKTKEMNVHEESRGNTRLHLE